MAYRAEKRKKNLLLLLIFYKKANKKFDGFVFIVKKGELIMKKNKSLFCLLALVSFLSLAACQTTSNTATNNSSTTGDYVYSSTAVSETASSVPATSVLLNTSVKTGKTVQDTSYNCKVTLARILLLSLMLPWPQ